MKNAHGRKTDENWKTYSIYDRFRFRFCEWRHRVPFFDLDYSAYVIEHFPYMEFENPKLADKFVNTIDRVYDRGTALGLSDEDFRAKISDAFDKWLGN